MAQCEIRFDGQAVLVTGAGRGLGRAHALLLASRGAKVVVADNGVAMDGEDASAGPAESVVAEIIAAGGEAVPCTADLASEIGSQMAVETAVRAFGTISGVLHNASTVPALTPPDAIASRDLDLVLRVNASAGLWLARAAWPHMIRQKYGRILYTTSAAIFGAEGNAPYATAKAAVIGTMRCLAAEGARHGIHVNVVAPSARTRMTEGFLSSAYADWLFKTMPPEKVAAGAAYLMSAACNVTGEIFSMGGGRIARILIAETEGVIGAGASIEEVRDALPSVMADREAFYPKDLTERSAKVAALLGFPG